MRNISRRGFLKGSLAASAGLAMSTTILSNSSKAFGPNDTIGIGVIGTGGRGSGLANDFSKRDGAHLVAVADADISRAGKFKDRGCNTYQDLRKLLDDPAVDAVVIATCNHWHCLAAIWAMQAGKDVYVEKPLSHTQWEGRQVVKAARKYDKICQLGTQQRSDPLQSQVKKFLHEEKGLGDILYAQANRLGPRASIGKRDTPLTPPAEVDYNLWLGPAQDQPIYRDSFHYDWHWDFNTGSGEMGNWGVHVLDDVRNVVYQDKVKTPKRILAVGGRVAWNDAGNTPNVHYVFYDTGDVPCLIALSNLNKGPNTKGSWPTKAGRPVNGPSVGYVVACEGGYYMGHRGGGKAVDLEGKEIKSFRGGDMQGIHEDAFLDAVRERDNSLLGMEIEKGHDSTGWCNLANVAFQAGGEVSRAKAESIAPNFETWGLLLDEMEENLAPFGVKTSDAEMRMSPILEHDPEAEQFVGDSAAIGNPLLKREYREGFVVPEEV